MSRSKHSPEDSGGIGTMKAGKSPCSLRRKRAAPKASMYGLPCSIDPFSGGSPTSRTTSWTFQATRSTSRALKIVARRPELSTTPAAGGQHTAANARATERIRLLRAAAKKAAAEQAKAESRLRPIRVFFSWVACANGARGIGSERVTRSSYLLVKLSIKIRRLGTIESRLSAMKPGSDAAKKILETSHPWPWAGRVVLPRRAIAARQRATVGESM